jgi:hypothetical protein
MEEEKPVNIQQGHGSAENELEATTERIQKLATVLFDLNEEKASDKPVLSLSQLLVKVFYKLYALNIIFI